MEPMFKILQNITCGFTPDDPPRAASEFPKGTDFKRLVDIGAIRPTNLLGKIPGSDDKNDLLDEIEELQFKLQRAESKAEADAQVAADTIQKQAELIQRLTSERDDALLMLASKTNDAKPDEPKPEEKPPETKIVPPAKKK